MKVFYNLCLLFFLTAFYAASGQSTDGTEFINNAASYKIDFEKKYFPGHDKMPFKDIVVMDYRYDNSKIGYVEADGSSRYSKIQLTQDWSSTLNSYFRKNLDTSSSQTLVIVIRSFWLQGGIADELTTKKVIQKRVWGSGGDVFSKENGNCKAGLDIYIQSGSTLQAFFKLDTAFLNFYKFKPKNLEAWFFLPFDSVARKIIATDIVSVLSKRKKISREELAAYYKQRFDLPVLATELPEKAIFLNFEDFKKNKPLVTNFRYSNGKLTDQLYLVEHGQETLLTEFWGFTENGKLFVRCGFNIYAAVRQQNSFEVFGGKHISNYRNYTSEHDLIKINSMNVERKILALNMESGEFY